MKSDSPHIIASILYKKIIGRLGLGVRVSNDPCFENKQRVSDQAPGSTREPLEMSEKSLLRRQTRNGSGSSDARNHSREGFGDPGQTCRDEIPVSRINSLLITTE